MWSLPLKTNLSQLICHSLADSLLDDDGSPYGHLAEYLIFSPGIPPFYFRHAEAPGRPDYGCWVEQEHSLRG
jgi:hypothetical protein